MAHPRLAAAVLALAGLTLTAPGPAVSQAFLEEGGGISTPPDAAIVEGRDRSFLDGGGGVATPPDAVLRDSDRRDDFLEDGGGIETRPGVVIEDRRGFGRVRPPATRRMRKGSRTFIVSDVGDGGGGAYPVSRSPRAEPGFAEGGPQVIDVQRERLDRHPVPAGTVRRVETGGGPEIIRIGEGYRRGGMRVADAGTTREPGPAASRRVTAGEPWSPAWLRRCTRRHASFDPAFGTYVGDDGRTRFCEGF